MRELLSYFATDYLAISTPSLNKELQILTGTETFAKEPKS